MKSPIATAACHSRLVRVAINLAAWLRRPANRAFYRAGILRELRRRPPSRLGILLAASHDQRKLEKINQKKC
jgi:hypothetical protein